MTFNPSKDFNEDPAKDNYEPGDLYFAVIAKVTFFLYLFFAFFGTGLPFREGGIRDTLEVTSNIVNQIVYSTLFITSVIALFPKRKQLLVLIKKEKFLTIFLIWCFLSIAWSNYSYKSFVRFFQYITTVQVIIAVLLYSKSSKELLIYFQYILGFYTIISIISVILIPGAREIGGVWRGIALTKNNLGQVAFISCLIWFFSIRDSRLIFKPIYLGLLLTSFILLIGSYSSTPLMTLLILLFIGFVLNINKIFESVGFRKTLVILFFVLLTIIGWLVFTQETYIVSQILSMIGKEGKDLTFTGRTYLWNYIINIAQSHLWTGCGFQGYWVGIDPRLSLLYDYLGWVPNQAHSGYVDLLNEIGIIGVIFFILVVINYYTNLVKLKKASFWPWFFIAALIIDFTESAFLRPHHAVGVMFMFSYLILFYELGKQNESYI
jgi:exopolysaccharide production protein ExoQ